MNTLSAIIYINYKIIVDRVLKIIKYINEDTLILDLECESNYNIKNSIIKELEFEPTLIYQLCDINGERLSKHQFNIIKAMSEAKKIGYS